MRHVSSREIAIFSGEAQKASGTAARVWGGEVHACTLRALARSPRAFSNSRAYYAGYLVPRVSLLDPAPKSALGAGRRGTLVGYIDVI